MKPGTIVQFRLDEIIGNPNIGIIISEIPPEKRGGDPFPMYQVLYGNQGVLTCRSTDLCTVQNPVGR